MTVPEAPGSYEGWDFDTVWALPEDLRTNQGYPYLRDVAEDLALGNWHPADLDRDWKLEEKEAEHYVKRWQTGNVDMTWAIKAAYISHKGEAYRYVSEEALPNCWQED